MKRIKKWVFDYDPDLPDGVYDVSIIDVGLYEIVYKNTSYKLVENTENYIIKNIDEVFCCSKCGSTDVETKQWVNVNNNQITGSCSDGESEDNYCNGCGEHPNLITLKEYLDIEEENKEIYG